MKKKGTIKININQKKPINNFPKIFEFKFQEH